MKRNIKKLVSLVLVFAMSIAIAVPGFAATEKGSAQNAASVQSYSRGVTKYVNTGYGFDLYLSNSDALKVVSAGGITSSLLSLIPNKAEAAVAAVLVAGVLSDIQYQNSGTGVIIHFVYVYVGTSLTPTLAYIEPQPVPVRH